MAKISKLRSRKPIEDGPMTGSSVYYEHNLGGLIFRFYVGDHQVMLTHIERDSLIDQWTRLEKNWESA